MVDTIEDKIELLKQKKGKAQLGGGEEKIRQQREKGKLTARERINLLIDAASFSEYDLFMRDLDKKEMACDAVVTGKGLIDKRPVFLFSQDFTVMGGSLGGVHAKKICHILDQSLNTGIPMIGMNDSAGARVNDPGSSGYTDIFYRNTRLSGYVPQISVILGNCAGGAVYSPALTDFVFMVKGVSLMFITGPDVVKTVTGEEVTKEELGSADIHAHITGAAHFVADNEEECMKMVRKLMSYLPLNSMEQPPRLDLGDPAGRVDDDLRHVVPVNSAKSYDVRKLIRKIIDQGDFFEVHARFARNICIGFARMDGQTVGIVASQPIHMAGCLDINASVKAARFIRFCDAFNIPLLTFVDCPGYLPGAEQEQGAIIRHGAKLLFAYAEATVPKLTIVVRKAYGGAYSAMCAQGLGADFIVALPTAEFGVMGPEATVNLLFGKDLARSENPEKRREELIQGLRARYSHPYGSAAVGLINDVIDPVALRPYLIDLLSTYKNVKRTLPPKKHGNIPL